MIGRAPGALVLRSDMIRKRLVGVPPEEHLSAASYTPELNKRVYETITQEATVALAAGQCVVVDAVFAREEERQAVENSAAIDYPFVGIWLDVPETKLKDRVTKRIGDISDATPDVVSQQLLMNTGNINWHRLDASGGPQETLILAHALMPPGAIHRLD